MSEISRKELLNNLQDSVKINLAKLSIDHCTYLLVLPESFKKDEFWKNIDFFGGRLLSSILPLALDTANGVLLVESSKLISHEATKLSLVFSKPPLPDVATLKPICHAVQMASERLIYTLIQLPEAEGTVLRQLLREDVLDIFKALNSLLTDLLSYEEKGVGELKVTGVVWEKCEHLENMPQDNKTAVFQTISSLKSLIEDAQQELDEAIKKKLNYSIIDNAHKDDDDDDDDDDQTNWEGKDLEIVQASLGLIKSAHTCVKKACEQISTKAKTDEGQLNLDNAVTFTRILSDGVDDLVASLYQPLIELDVAEKAGVVAVNSQAVLSVINSSPFYTPEDDNWMKFLRGAVEHNFGKIENLTGSKVETDNKTKP